MGSGKLHYPLDDGEALTPWLRADGDGAVWSDGFTGRFALAQPGGAGVVDALIADFSASEWGEVHFAESAALKTNAPSW